VTDAAATIVIPSRGRIDALRATLEPLSRLEATPSWEVIVVDNGSPGESLRDARRLVEQHSFAGRLVEERKPGPAAARNRGAREATGSLLIFVDNDILVKPDFVKRHVAAHEASGGAWVVGRIVHPEWIKETPFGRYRDRVWERFHQTHTAERLGETSGMSAANLSVPRSDFESLGGFDEDFAIASCEDAELGHRARARGLRIVYDPDNVVVHNDWAVTLGRFCERQRLYSISDVLLYSKYGESSPRAALIRSMGPYDPGRDTFAAAARKASRAILGSRPGKTIWHGAVRVMERVAPDSAALQRAYDVAVGLAIREGVREGMRRYRSSEATP
jgi:GT2 family glycosyltransferase